MTKPKNLEENPLLTNMRRKPWEYSENNKGRWLKKMIIINNNIVWRGMTYNENYPKMVVDFCTNKKAYKSRKDKETGLMVKEANEYPTIQEFRVKHKIPRKTWERRAKDYEELSEALEIVKDHQEDMLIKNGLSARRNAQVVKSVGMAQHDWSEKKETLSKQETLTDDQKKKMFDEYMKSIEQKGMVIEGNVLDSKEIDANLWDDSWKDKE